jgi:hypothetical protein
MEARQRQLARAQPPTEIGSGFQYQHRKTRAGEQRRGRQPVGASADDDGVVGRRHERWMRALSVRQVPRRRAPRGDQLQAGAALPEPTPGPRGRAWPFGLRPTTAGVGTRLDAPLRGVFPHFCGMRDPLRAPRAKQESP